MQGGFWWGTVDGVEKRNFLLKWRAKTSLWKMATTTRLLYYVAFFSRKLPEKFSSCQVRVLEEIFGSDFYLSLCLVGVFWCCFARFSGGRGDWFGFPPPPPHECSCVFPLLLPLLVLLLCQWFSAWSSLFLPCPSLSFFFLFLSLAPSAYEQPLKRVNPQSDLNELSCLNALMDSLCDDGHGSSGCLSFFVWAPLNQI